MSKNTWINDNQNNTASFYLDEADDFIIERNTTRNILVRLFSYNFPEKKDLHLLELGCGNGYITYGIHESFPDNHFTLLDGNREMLDQARSLFSSMDNFTFIPATFEEFLVKQDTQTYDFIYSSNAIHHLNYRHKCRLYQYIFDRLHVGGLFINIDVVLPPTVTCEDWSFNLWKDWMQRKQAAQDSEDIHRYDTLPGIYKGKEENQPSGLDEQLEILRKTGFRNVDSYYKYGIFSLFGGTK